MCSTDYTKKVYEYVCLQQLRITALKNECLEVFHIDQIYHKLVTFEPAGKHEVCFWTDDSKQITPHPKLE